MICEAITDLHTMLMNRVLVDEDCLVIGITVSANESVVKAVNIAKNQGAKTVLITSKRVRNYRMNTMNWFLLR